MTVTVTVTGARPTLGPAGLAQAPLPASLQPTGRAQGPRVLSGDIEGGGGVTSNLGATGTLWHVSCDAASWPQRVPHPGVPQLDQW